MHWLCFALGVGVSGAAYLVAVRHRASEDAGAVTAVAVGLGGGAAFVAAGLCVSGPVPGPPGLQPGLFLLGTVQLLSAAVMVLMGSRGPVIGVTAVVGGSCLLGMAVIERLRIAGGRAGDRVTG